MEPLFGLNVENVDILLPNIKERLMLQDEKSQTMILGRLMNLFKSSSNYEREQMLAKLIKFDIISTLFDVLEAPDDLLLSNILEFLSLICTCRTFYQDYIVADSLDSMLKIAICTFKSHTKETQSLATILTIISEILQKSVEYNLNFDAVCAPQQMLHFLRLSIVERPSDQKLKFVAIKLLIIVLESATLEEECNDDVVFQLCHEALNSTKGIVEYSDNDVSISLAAAALCGICASASRFCDVENGEVEGSVEKNTQFKINLTDAIYKAVMNTLIPYIKNAVSIETDKVEFHRNFVTCLNNLYNLRNCRHDNLSNHLTSNGYLKYFLLLTTALPENLRRSTCILLSRIIITLAEKHLSIDHCAGGATGFANLVYQGLLSLAHNPQEWKDAIAYEESGGFALMILIYYHYHGTREADMISLKSLIERVMNLPESQPVTSQILKVLWFLFAVASISHAEPISEPNYIAAVKRLSSILQRSRLHDCYTHHIDLLHYCLKRAEIPRDLRNKVMDLWLIESNGDIKPLLSLDCNTVVRYCLLIVIQTGYPESVINLAMKGIRELMNTDNVQEIVEIAWHMLPNFLSSYQSNKDEQIKAILEMTNASTPPQLSLGSVHRCADGLLNIILRKESDLKLKTLAIMQAHVLLVTTVTRHSFRVLEKYVDTVGFLEELRARVFSVENIEFSAVCSKLLSFIIHCQGESSYRRKKAVTFDVQSLSNLLINTRKSPRALINGMQLVLELLTGNIDGSAVRIKKYSNNTNEVGGVINLYETLHIIQGKSDPTQRDLVHQCLSAVLLYSQKHTVTSLYHICTSMSNYNLITYTLNTRHVSSHFLKFVSTWLCCRKRYCDDEGSWNSRSLCRTPFEETLNRIRKHVETVNEASMDEAYYNLHYALSQFKE